MTVVLLSCSATKLPHPAPARELYRGQRFQKALRWAYRKFGPGVEVAVLSAKHGLVGIDQILAPYDSSVLVMRKAELAEWAARTREQLVARYPGAHFVAVVPMQYTAALEGLDAEVPFRGMKLGPTLRELDR